MSNIKISQLTQFTGSSSNTWLVMNNSGQTETFKITRESLLSGLIQCSNVLASESLQSNNFFSVDDLDLNISTRTNSGTKNINLMTGPKPGGLGYTRVKITSGGTVGINTDSPTAQLDVSVPTGTTVGLRISGNSSADMVRITQVGTGHTFVIEDSQNPDSTPFVIRNDGKVYMGTYTEETTSLLNVGGSAVFWGSIFLNGTTNRVISNSVDGRALINFSSIGDSYLNNGNFGIGTILPGARLDVTPPTGSTIGLRVSGNSSADMVRITQTGSGNAFVVEDNENPDLNSFVIGSDGKVGIGYSSTEPLNQKLNISGSAYATVSLISLTLQANTIYPANDYDLNITTREGNSGTKNIYFGTGNSGGTPFTRMTITSGGTVGIGTTNPNPFTLNQADGKLHVKSGDSGVTGGTGGGTVVIEASTTNYLQMYSTDENLTGIVFGSPSDAFGSFMRWSHNQGKLEISTANSNDYIELGVGNNNVKAYVSNNGFGVNTLPSQALHISGNTLIEGDIIYPSPSTPPVSSGSTGTKGTVTWDGSYFYICVDTNTWKRSQLLSW